MRWRNLPEAKGGVKALRASEYTFKFLICSRDVNWWLWSLEFFLLSADSTFLSRCLFSPGALSTSECFHWTVPGWLQVRSRSHKQNKSFDLVEHTFWWWQRTTNIGCGSGKYSKERSLARKRGGLLGLMSHWRSPCCSLIVSGPARAHPAPGCPACWLLARPGAVPGGHFPQASRTLWPRFWPVQLREQGGVSSQALVLVGGCCGAGVACSPTWLLHGTTPCLASSLYTIAYSCLPSWVFLKLHSKDSVLQGWNSASITSYLLASGKHLTMTLQYDSPLEISVPDRILMGSGKYGDRFSKVVVWIKLAGVIKELVN